MVLLIDQMTNQANNRPEKQPDDPEIAAASSLMQTTKVESAPTQTPGATGASSFARTSVTVFVCGLGLGILVGLAVAPVVGTVVSGLIALVAGLLTIAKNFRLTLPPTAGNTANRVYHFSMDSPVGPEVAVLAVGLVAGAMLGLYIRNNDVLGPSFPAVPDASPAAGKLRLAQAGSDRQQSSPETVHSGLGGVVTGSASVLFGSQTSGACAASLGTMTEAELKRQLEAANPRMKAFLAKQEWAKLPRAQLVVLAQTLACPQTLSEGELAELRRDRNRASSHYNPLVSRLGRDLGDYDLLLAVLTDVLGPPK